MRESRIEGLIDVWDLGSVQARRPVLVAHRGGVIAPNAPENSLAAIRLAAASGYHMVELDVRVASDGVPVLFHGSAGSGLSVDCGIEEFVEDLTSEELQSIRYRESTEHIALLSDALDLCASLRLGVMLDVKAGDPPQVFVSRIGDLLHSCGLDRAALTISHDPGVRDGLAETVLPPVSREDYRRVLGGEALSLEGQFWFGWAADLPSDAVSQLQVCGAFAIVSINTFHYPSHARDALARQDIERLYTAGVEGFQIDSVFREFVPTA